MIAVGSKVKTARSNWVGILKEIKNPCPEETGRFFVDIGHTVIKVVSISEAPAGVPVYTKKCRGCFEWLTFAEFTKDNKKQAGVTSRCKVCHAEYEKKRRMSA